jgi:hypothetical protein
MHRSEDVYFFCSNPLKSTDHSRIHFSRSATRANIGFVGFANVRAGNFHHFLSNITRTFKTKIKL